MSDDGALGRAGVGKLLDDEARRRAKVGPAFMSKSV